MSDLDCPGTSERARADGTSGSSPVSSSLPTAGAGLNQPGLRALSASPSPAPPPVPARPLHARSQLVSAGSESIARPNQYWVPPVPPFAQRRRSVSQYPSSSHDTYELRQGTNQNHKQAALSTPSFQPPTVPLATGPNVPLREDPSAGRRFPDLEHPSLTEILNYSSAQYNGDDLSEESVAKDKSVDADPFDDDRGSTSSYDPDPSSRRTSYSTGVLSPEMEQLRFQALPHTTSSQPGNRYLQTTGPATMWMAPIVPSVDVHPVHAEAALSNTTHRSPLQRALVDNSPSKNVNPKSGAQRVPPAPPLGFSSQASISQYGTTASQVGIPTQQNSGQRAKGSRMPKPRNSYNPPLDRVRPFINKLRFMMLNPQIFGSVICWSEDGQCVLVDVSNPELASDILPRVFQHSKPTGLMRQFATYGFSVLNGNAASLALMHSLPDVDVGQIPDQAPVASTSTIAPGQDLVVADSTPEVPASSVLSPSIELEPKSITDSPRNPEQWKVYRHTHTRQDLEECLAEEAEVRRLALESTLRRARQERKTRAKKEAKFAGIPYVSDDDNDDEDEDELAANEHTEQGDHDKQDGSEVQETTSNKTRLETEEEQDVEVWFSRDTMYNQKLLARLRPKSKSVLARKKRGERDDEEQGQTGEESSKRVKEMTQAPEST
ncbi:uncharacterized protein JCM15063_004636 [Sporobolomyces koalae]|uniref:uncharacterized protein n=1 Tax=Sporobolomyces koalae TaxID=500713 RepID=UPI00316CB995